MDGTTTYDLTASLNAAGQPAGGTVANVTNLNSNYATIAGSGASVISVNGRVGAVTLTKTDVGLDQVDNTSDVNKPVSTAQAASIATKEPVISTGTTLQYWRGDKSWQTLPTSLPPNGSAGGDLTGTYPNPTLSATAVTAGAYTNANITVDTKGRITAASNGSGGGSGTVTSISVVSANGLAGTVSNPTTTPAVTLSTTVNGIVKGNGTTLSAATAGTDYLTPSGNGSALTGITESQVTNLTTDLAAKAPLASPTFTGTPTAPTASPSDNSTKIATTAYVDSAILGQNYKEASKYATTAALPSVTYSNGSSGVGATLTAVLAGALTIDGNNPSVGDRVLVKNQSSSLQNGIYTVTVAGSVGVAFVLTRATDSNQSAEWHTGDSVFITAGTANSTTTWAYTGIDNPVMGTTNITFAQIAGQGSFTAGTGISITGNSISLSTPVSVANGGTGQSTQQTAMDALAGTQSSGKYLRSDGTHTTLTTIQAADVPTLNQNTTGSAATLTTARTIAGVSFDGSANISLASTNLSDTASIALLTSTQTFTNKRNTPRTGSTTSSATPAINTDNYDEFDITALATAITSMSSSLTGTPNNGDEIMIRFKDNGTARAITWGTSFASSGVATLLATTVASKTHFVKLRYDSTAAKWVCLAVDAVGY